MSTTHHVMKCNCLVEINSIQFNSIQFFRLLDLEYRLPDNPCSPHFDRRASSQSGLTGTCQKHVALEPGASNQNAANALPGLYDVA